MQQGISTRSGGLSPSATEKSSTRKCQTESSTECPFKCDWENARGPGLLGATRLVVFPRFLTPCKPKSTTSREEVPAREGLMTFSNCGWFGRGNTRNRVPLTSLDPSPLLSYRNPVPTLLNTNFILPRECDLGTPKALFKELPEISGKFRAPFTEKRNVNQEADPRK